MHLNAENNNYFCNFLYFFVAVLTTDLSSSQSRRALLRWEMSSDSLNEDDSRLVTEIKKLLAS